MKPSQFNVLVDVDPRGTVVHNTESARSLVVPGPIARWLETARTTPLPAALYPSRYRALLEPLVRGGFVVDDDIDELQVQIHRRRVSRFAADRCSLQVQVIQTCNLACKYCIQTFSPMHARMSLDTADDVVKFAQRTVLQSRARLLVVTMYGGEPLMNEPVCRHIMSQMAGFAANRRIELSLPVVTNGVLLVKHRDSPVIELASGFHITFEGGKQRHDSIRKQRDGAGSYDRIVAGIAMLRRRDVRVRVRLHVNGVERDELLHLLDELQAAGVVPDRRRCDMYWTNSEDASEAKSFEGCAKERAINWEKNRDHVFALHEAARHHPLGVIIEPGFNPGPRHTSPEFRADAHWKPRPAQHCSGCPLDSISSFFVTPDGGLYSCPDDPRPEVKMGNIQRGGDVEYSEARSRLLTRDYWPDKACARCEFLPVCGGGCPLDRPDAVEDCETRRTKLKDTETYIAQNPPPEPDRGAIQVQQPR
ncbi:MAG: radical SAM protein [Deltaproteobacteria bacterium]|nr:MAG: radical SAM protein [Deltaproteobacteria bacterium]